MRWRSFDIRQATWYVIVLFTHALHACPPYLHGLPETQEPERLLLDAELSSATLKR